MNDELRRKLPKWAGAVDKARRAAQETIVCIADTRGRIDRAGIWVTGTRSMRPDGDDFVVCSGDVELYRGPDEKRAWAEFSAIPFADRPLEMGERIASDERFVGGRGDG